MGRAKSSTNRRVYAPAVARELAAWQEELCPGYAATLAALDAQLANLTVKRQLLLNRVAPTLGLTIEPYLRLWLREHPDATYDDAVISVCDALDNAPPPDLSHNPRGRNPSVPRRTSEAAAAFVDSGALRGQVYSDIRRQGIYGATTEEVEIRRGMKHQTASPRVVELETDFGVIVDSGMRRKTQSGCKAIVYVATNVALAALCRAAVHQGETDDTPAPAPSATPAPGLAAFLTKLRA